MQREKDLVLVQFVRGFNRARNVSVVKIESLSIVSQKKKCVTCLYVQVCGSWWIRGKNTVFTTSMLQYYPCTCGRQSCRHATNNCKATTILGVTASKTRPACFPQQDSTGSRVHVLLAGPVGKLVLDFTPSLTYSIIRNRVPKCKQHWNKHPGKGSCLTNACFSEVYKADAIWQELERLNRIVAHIHLEAIHSGLVGW